MDIAGSCRRISACGRVKILKIEIVHLGEDDSSFRGESSIKHFSISTGIYLFIRLYIKWGKDVLESKLF